MKKVLSIALLLSGIVHAATEVTKEVTVSRTKPTQALKGTMPQPKSESQEDKKRAEGYSNFDRSEHPAGFVAATEQPLTKEQQEKIEKKHEKEMAQWRAKFEQAEKGRKEALAKLNATQAELEKEANTVHTHDAGQEVGEMSFSTLYSFMPLVTKAKTMVDDYLKANPALDDSLEKFKKAATKNIDHLKHTYKEVKKVMGMEDLYMDEQFTTTLKEIASEFGTMLSTLPKNSSEAITDTQKEALKASMNKILLNVHTATTRVMKHVGTATDKKTVTKSEKPKEQWAMKAAKESETAKSPVSMKRKAETALETPKLEKKAQ